MRSRSKHIIRNRYKLSGVLIVILLSWSGISSAQNFQTHQFGISDGLPTFFSKAITQDSLGYIWAATDEGVVRYDGNHIEVFSNRIPSHYVKDVGMWSPDTVYSITDKGISLFPVRHHLDEVIYFDELLDSSGIFEFPRSLVKTSDGSRWISQPEGLIRLQNGDTHIFKLPQPYGITGYGNPFFVVENEKQIYVISEQGLFYEFDAERSEMIKLSVKGKLETIHSVTYWNNQLLIGTEKGLAKATITDRNGQKRVSVSLWKPMNAVTALEPYINQTLLIGTRSTGVFLFTENENRSVVNNRPIQGLTNMFIDKNDHIWVSSDQGIFLLEQNLFQQIILPGDYQNVEDILASDDGAIFASHLNTVTRIDFNNLTDFTKEVLFTAGTTIMSMGRLSENEFIAGLSNGAILHIKDGLISTVNPRTDRGGSSLNASVFNLLVDSQKRTWFTFGGIPLLGMRDSDGSYRLFGPEQGILNEILDIAEDKSGNIFVSSHGLKNLLLKFNQESEKFEPVEIKVPFDQNVLGDISDRIQTHDIEITPEGDMLLATSFGIVDVHENEIFFLEGTEQFPHQLIRAIEADNKGTIWIGAENGVFQLKDGNLIEYGVDDGLPSVTVNYRAMKYADNRLWIGTTNGLAVSSHHLNESQSAPIPVIKGVRTANQVVSNPGQNLSIFEGETAEFLFSTLNYPASRTHLFYKFRDEAESEWRTESVNSGIIRLTPEKIGKRTLLVRTSKRGFGVGPVASVHFTVKPHWYNAWYARVIYFALAGFIILIFIRYRNSVSEQQLTSEQLRETEKQLQLVVDNSPIILFIINKHGVFELVTGKGVAMSDIDEREFTGRHVDDIYSESEIHKKVHEALAGKQVQYLRFLGDKFFETRLTPVFDDKGKLKEVLGVSVDVTERIENERKLTRAKEFAEQANKAKSVFLANMSHELRTPLNAILGFSELLKKKNDSDSTIQKYTQTIYQSGEHLLHMINDILDLSKIESGKMDLVQEGFQLKSLIGDIESMFSVHAEQKGLYFKLNISPELPKFIYADYRKLKQVIINLLGNAVKYTESGGITLRIWMSGEDRSKRIHIDVCDTGKGIPKQLLDHIYEPFKQAKENYSSGTGLGLSIVKNILDIMGGEISADSEIGVGTTFTIIIPVTIIHEMSSGENRVSDHIDQYYHLQSEAELEAWIVDDKVPNQDLLIAYLTDYGIQCKVASHGDELLAMLKEEQYKTPDIIFLDVFMPHKNGKETMKEMQTLFRYKEENLPVVIAISASNNKELQDELLELGFSEYFSKPFREKELITILKTYFNNKMVSVEKRHQSKYGELSESELITEIIRSINQMESRKQEALIEAIEITDIQALEQLLMAEKWPVAIEQHLQHVFKQKHYTFLFKLNEEMS